VQGLGFFESPCVRVRLTFGEGPTDTLVLDAAFEGDATQVRLFSAHRFLLFSSFLFSSLRFSSLFRSPLLAQVVE
jgi:hypothetical protein